MFDEVLQPFFKLQKNHRVTLGILSFLILAVVVTFFQMINEWRNDFASFSTQPQTQPKFLADDSSARLIEELPDKHLFGQALAADDFLPITSLQVRLTGIIKSANSDKSQAIISETNQTGKIYSVGDVLTAGIKIYAINEDGIVLEHAGRLEKLPLMRGQLSFQDKPKTLWGDDTSA